MLNDTNERCIHCNALLGEKHTGFCPTRDAEFVLEAGETDVTELHDPSGNCLCCGAPAYVDCGCVVIAVTCTHEPFLWCAGEHQGRELSKSGPTDRRDDLGGSIRLDD